MVQLKIQNNIVLPPTKVILNNAIYSILPNNFNSVLKDLWNINPNNPNELQATYYIEDNNILAVTATIQQTETPNNYNLIGFKLESEHPIIKEMNEEVNNELFTISPLDEFFIMNAYELSEDLMELDNKIHSTDNDNINFCTALANSKDIYDEFKNMGVSSKSLYKDWQDIGISDLNFFDLIEDENTMGKDLMYQIDIEEPRTIEMFYSDIKDHITNALIQIVKKHKEKNDTNLQYYVEDFNILNFYFMPENYNLFSKKYDDCQSILQKRDITLFYNEKYNDAFFAESKLDYKTASYTEVSTSEKLRLTINEELALLRYFIYKYNIE